MKKQKVQAKINLEALAGGAFAEKLNEALMQVAENIRYRIQPANLWI